MCKFSASVTNKFKLLIDTGSDVNLIKINCLNGELLVNKKKNYI